MGWVFWQLLQQCGIRVCPTTSQNPQENAICERMHQTVGNVLQTLLYSEVATLDNVNDIVGNASATASHTLRAAISRSLNFNSPGELVFGRHMFLNLPLQADFMVPQHKLSCLILSLLLISHF